MNASMLARGALLLIDKPEGLTSHDVVERVRKATGVARIGHTGTLDPMATGLLLLCAGRAARLQGFFTGLGKSYEGVLRLGAATTTYDREGEVVGPVAADIRADPEELERAAEKFRGEFQQSPPPFSAKKVGGRKFYDMARRGEAVPAAPKTVRVAEFRLGPRQDLDVPFTLTCSSGTYVRSIAHDLGQTLGCGAHLVSLRRRRIGDFSLDDAVPLARFLEMGPEERSQRPHAVPLSEIPFPFTRMRVTSLEAWKLRKGQAIPAKVAADAGDWVSLVGPGDELLALGQVTPIGSGKVSLIRPRIVLAE
jgi:tRNA pseudouridine55 synthase